MNVNAGMRTEIDLTLSEVDVNKCEQFLKAKFLHAYMGWSKYSEIDLNWVLLQVTYSFPG